MVTDEHGWIQKMPIICRCWDHLTPWSVLENAAKLPRECPIATPKKAGRVWGQRWKGLHEPWEIVKLEMIEQTNRRLHQENKHVEQLWTHGRQNDLGRKKKSWKLAWHLHQSISSITRTFTAPWPFTTSPALRWGQVFDPWHQKVCPTWNDLYLIFNLHNCTILHIFTSNLIVSFLEVFIIVPFWVFWQIR